MINPRAGTFSTKPAYRNACKYQRCLIPAEGFYEWQAGQGGKTPFLIRCKDNAPFAISGL
jgi:putative SOS response-associated peptidase YedK